MSKKKDLNLIGPMALLGLGILLLVAWPQIKAAAGRLNLGGKLADGLGNAAAGLADQAGTAGRNWLAGAAGEAKDEAGAAWDSITQNAQQYTANMEDQLSQWWDRAKHTPPLVARRDRQRPAPPTPEPNEAPQAAPNTERPAPEPITAPAPVAAPRPGSYGWKLADLEAAADAKARPAPVTAYQPATAPAAHVSSLAPALVTAAAAAPWWVTAAQAAGNALRGWAAGLGGLSGDLAGAPAGIPILVPKSVFDIYTSNGRT